MSPQISFWLGEVTSRTGPKKSAADLIMWIVGANQYPTGIGTFSGPRAMDLVT
jgi:hypothetical protein